MFKLGAAMLSFRRVFVPYRTIIQNRCFFPLWLGQLVSSLGHTLNDIARALLMLALVAAPNIESIDAITILVALATTFFHPAVQAVIPALVGEQELLAANSVA